MYYTALHKLDSIILARKAALLSQSLLMQTAISALKD